MRAVITVISLVYMLFNGQHCFTFNLQQFSESDWAALVYDQKYDEAGKLLDTEIENHKHGKPGNYALCDLYQFKLTLQELRKDKIGVSKTFEELLNLLKSEKPGSKQPTGSESLQFCYVLDSYKLWLEQNNISKANTFMASEYAHCKQTSAYKPKWAPDVDAGCMPDSSIDTTDRFEVARNAFGPMNNPYPGCARIILKHWKPAKLFQSPVVLIIIGKQGEVKNCHLIRSLGNPKLNSEAVSLIKGLHFLPGPGWALKFDLRFIQYSTSLPLKPAVIRSDSIRSLRGASPPAITK